MTAAETAQLFEKMGALRVVVIGDVMLDNYWWGEVERISPEAPVPVVSLHRRESRLGGAANVALNCRALGAEVEIASVVGDDAEGREFVHLAAAEGIGTTLVHHSPHRPTTTKARVMGHRQQMLRIDQESTAELTVEEEHPFIDALLRHLQKTKPDVVIFEDYDKGVLKENVIQRAVAHCAQIGCVTAVDPKRRNFLHYRGVTLFKPNLKEVREGLAVPLAVLDAPALADVDAQLRAKLGHRITLLTLSEHGVFVADGHDTHHIPSHRRSIADVSGAGDTVIATAALCYAASGDARKAAALANLAGGLVCEEVGVVPINRARLLAEAERVLGG